MGQPHQAPMDIDDDKTVMSLAELTDSLKSLNVEVLYAGLKKFEVIMKRLLDETVDRELSDEALLMKSYFKMSAECKDILAAWSYQLIHSVTKLECVILDVIHHVIVCTKFLGGTRSIGTNLVRSIIRNNMSSLYKTMSTQSSSTTKELYESFQFTLKVLKDVLKMRKKAKGESESGEVVNDENRLGSELLKDLCTKPGFGICFKDNGWYADRFKLTTIDVDDKKSKPRQKNAHLVRWARSLRPSENETDMEILLEFLKSCPSQTPSYCEGISLSFEPRLSEQWLSNMALIARLIRLPIPDLTGLTNGIGRSILSRGLQHRSHTVRNSTAVVLSFSLEKLLQFRLRLKNLDISTEQDSMLSATMKIIMDEIWKRIPDIQTVFGFRTTFAEPQTKKKGGDDEIEREDEEEDFDVTEEVLRCSGLQLLRLYVALYPGYAVESRFDFTKLLPTSLNEVSYRVRRYILALIEEAPAFKWWAAADGKSSHLHTLLTLMASTSANDERIFIVKVVRSLLVRSDIFRGFGEEVEIWLGTLLDHVQNSAPELEAIISFIDIVLQTSIKNLLNLYDKLSTVASDTLVEMTTFKNDIHRHVLTSWRHGQKNLNLPFSTAMISSLHILTGIQKGKEMEEANYQAIWKFFSIICRRVLLETQGVNNFVLHALTTSKTDIAQTLPAQWISICEENLTALISFSEIKMNTPALKRAQRSTEDIASLLQQLSTPERRKELVLMCESRFPLRESLFAYTLPLDCLKELSLELLLSTSISSGDMSVMEIIFEKISTINPSSCKRLVNIALFALSSRQNCRDVDAVFFIDVLSHLLKKAKDLQSKGQGGALVRELENVIFGHPVFFARFCDFGDALKIDESNAKLDLLVTNSLKGLDKRSTVNINTYIVKLSDFSKKAIHANKVPGVLLHMWEDMRKNITVDVANDVLNIAASDKDVILDENLASLVSILLSIVSNVRKSFWLHRGLLEKLTGFLSSCSDTVFQELWSSTLEKLITIPSAEGGEGEVLIRDEASGGAFEDYSFALQGTILSTLTKGDDSHRLFLLKRLCSHNAGICWLLFGQAHGLPKQLTADVFEILALSHRLAPPMNETYQNELVKIAQQVKTLFIAGLDGQISQQVSSRALSLALNIDTIGGPKEFLIQIRDLVLSGESDLTTILSRLPQHLPTLVNGAKYAIVPHACMAIILHTVVILMDRLAASIDDESSSLHEPESALIIQQMSSIFEFDAGKNLSQAFFEQPNAVEAATTLISKALRSNLTHAPLLTISKYLARVLMLTSTNMTESLPFELCQALIENPNIHTILATGYKSADQTSQTHASRKAILELILDLIQHDPKQCCRLSLLSAVVKALKGLANYENYVVLNILQVFETKAEVSTANMILQWNASLSEDTNRIQAASSIIPQTLASKALESLDAQKLERTIHRFPIGETLNLPTSIKDVKEDHERYSIPFLLPFIGQVVSHAKEALDLGILIDTQCLSFVLMCLTNLNEHVREAGYYILDRVYPLLSRSETVKEGNQVLLVLSRLKNIIVDRSTKSPRIPTLSGLFLVESLRVMKKPESPLYPLINSFFLARPLLDDEDVPMFYALFNSTSENARVERQWLLRLLADGIKCDEDYKLYRRRFVFDLLFNFYNAAYAEPSSKRSIMELLDSLSVSPSTVSDLCSKHGLIPFLFTLLEAVPREPATAKAIGGLCLKYFKSFTSSPITGGKLKIMQSLALLGLNTLQSISTYLLEPTRGFEASYYIAILDLLELFTLISESDMAMDGVPIINFNVLKSVLRLFPADQLSKRLILGGIEKNVVDLEDESELRDMVVAKLFNIIVSNAHDLFVTSSSQDSYHSLVPWLLDVTTSFSHQSIHQASALFLGWLADMQQQSRGYLPELMLASEETARPSFAHRLLRLLASVQEISCADAKSLDGHDEELLRLAVLNYTLLTSDVLRICSDHSGLLANLLTKEVCSATVDTMEWTASTKENDMETDGPKENVDALMFYLFQLLWGFNFHAAKGGLPIEATSYIKAWTDVVSDIPGPVVQLVTRGSSGKKRASPAAATAAATATLEPGSDKKRPKLRKK
ncbi:hypothetical protein BC829DRAFT_440099 [Chytridium lagenaria]|nr:hypothetical protein BC829DRAFT_440099 [Chytridium lagenaria]